MKEIYKSMEQFYKNSGIDMDLYACCQSEAYEKNKMYDPKIAKENLEDKIKYWIERFDEQDKDYFMLLFENYLYISESEYRKRIWRLCQTIFDDLNVRGINKEEVLFVTISSPTGMCGGGDSLRNHLLVVNQDWAMNKYHIVSDVDKMDIHIMRDKKAIVFIDDILGTGFSMKNTIKKFLDKVADYNKYSFFITGILMTKNATDFILKKIHKEYSLEMQELGTTDNYIRSCMKGNYIFASDKIKEIEEILEKYEQEIGIEGDKSFVMGFRKCKLLLSFYYNTPNNTLCSFWKCTEKNIPIFPRDKYGTATLKAIQERKNKNRDNAYRKGCVDTYENA